MICYIQHWFNTFLQQGISEPVFADDLVYKFKIIVGKPIFSDQFRKILKNYKKLDITWNRFNPCSKMFLLTVQRQYFFCGSFVLLSLVFVMLLRLFIAVLWSPAGKELPIGSCL